jgi:hypothetical protein
MPTTYDLLGAGLVVAGILIGLSAERAGAKAAVRPSEA